jgi:hypothetical protein
MISRESGRAFRDLASANQGGAQGRRGYIDIDNEFWLLPSMLSDLTGPER